MSLVFFVALHLLRLFDIAFMIHGSPFSVWNFAKLTIYNNAKNER